MSSHEYFDHLHESRILIVEDDGDLARLVQKRFLTDGFTVVDIVENGGDALVQVMAAVTQRKPYDLLLLDLCLPGNPTGQDVYQNVSSSLDLPIVVMSGLSEREQILSALKTDSVEDYFTKPFDLEVLFLRCERILGRRIFNRHLQKSHRRNQMLFLNVLQVMAKVLEAKDPYTKFHSENVAKYARQIAKRVGYTDHQLEMIQIAGVLHDFGKIGIKESVLNKPGALTNFEYEAVKRHPLIASAILEPIEELKTIMSDIRHHHERWDGSGYPDGIAGEAIPLGARILSVADSYDAMTSSRSYHEPLSEEEARDELVACKGKQFDPDLVDLFVEVLEENQRRRTQVIRLREDRA